jgi:hypothetical protein
MFSWSCQPKHLLAGIIKKASIKSFELLMMIAVICGTGGSYLKVSSMECNFNFSIMEQRTSYSLVSAKSYGDLAAMILEVF